MNKTRCFAFGCSYTRHVWASWADFIGVNFDEYYNYGRGGASNTFIMNRLFELDKLANFNPDTDYILIMITGIDRFSYVDKKTGDWALNGEIYNYSQHHENLVISEFVKNMWNEKWAIYMSWIAISAMKTFLQSKNLKHSIVQGVDNQYNKQPLNQLALEKVNDIYKMLTIQESMDAFIGENKNLRDVKFDLNNFIDGHPNQQAHFNFVSKHFPEFVTSKTIDTFNTLTRQFDFTSRENQASKYNTFFDNLRKISYQLY
jgi:hypothetical protein